MNLFQLVKDKKSPIRISIVRDWEVLRESSCILDWCVSLIEVWRDEVELLSSYGNVPWRIDCIDSVVSLAFDRVDWQSIPVERNIFHIDRRRCSPISNVDEFFNGERKIEETDRSTFLTRHGIEHSDRGICVWCHRCVERRSRGDPDNIVQLDVSIVSTRHRARVRTLRRSMTQLHDTFHAREYLDSVLKPKKLIRRTKRPMSLTRRITNFIRKCDDRCRRRSTSGAMTSRGRETSTPNDSGLFS